MNKIKKKLIICLIGLAGYIFIPKIELLVKYCLEFQKVFILKILSIIVLLLIVVAYFIFAIFSNRKKIKEYVSKFSSLLFMYRFNCFFIKVEIVFFY